MLFRSLAAALALAVAPLGAFAADEENPYKDAKVGDFVKYNVKFSAGPIAQEGTITQTVTAKSDKEVTVKITGKLGETTLPEQEQKIDLTKPFDPTKAGNIPGGGDAKIEKQKEGKEKVKVGNKEYDSVWTTYKFTAKVMGFDIDGDIKSWTSKEVRGGMVKMDMTANFAKNEMKMTMEVIETGNKKPKD